MIGFVLAHTVPAAYALLPPAMASPEASAFLLAIGLQESAFVARRQAEGGPARGFWQFERAGLLNLRRHKRAAGHVAAVLEQLCYPIDLPNASMLAALEHHDPLAAACARLSLWTLPHPLPGRGDAPEAWSQYLLAWHPGAPRPKDWPDNFRRAWALVDDPDAGELV